MTESSMSADALPPDEREFVEDLTGSGWLSFAGLLILLLGIVNALEGIVALWNDKYGAFIGGSFYLFDLTWWGIIHAALGVLMIAVGVGILAGQEWARGLGVGLAGAAAIIQMLYLTSAPLWSLVNIGICILVIYALVVPPRGAIAD
ncbi:MAG TPA: hypothetical protein DGT23_23400 [Micromonosporaceae bacterium]|nr:hypothetical protein [Micromonosporaceae bacterium]